MDKIRISAEISDLSGGWYIVSIKEGVEIQVRRDISCKEKQQMAFEWAGAVLIENEEYGFAYKSFLYDVVKTYMYARYFTNIDTESSDMEDVYDYFVKNELWARIADILCVSSVSDHIEDVENMVNRIIDAVCEMTKVKNSLAQKVKTSFASVLSDEDLAEGLAKSQALNEKMITLLGDVAKESAQGKVSPVRVGNGTLNFSKK